MPARLISIRLAQLIVDVHVCLQAEGVFGMSERPVSHVT